MPGQNPKKILIIKPSSLGDIVQSLPVAGALKRTFPEAAISWVVNRQYISFLELCPDIDNVIPFERYKWTKLFRAALTLKEFSGFIRILRNESFEMVLDLQGLFRSGLMAFLTCSPVRIGFKDAREGAPLFYTKRVEADCRKVYAVNRYLTAAECAGCQTGNPVFRIELPHFLQEIGDKFWRGAGGKFIVIHAGGRWETKQWPKRYFAQLIKELYKKYYNARIIIIGNEDDVSNAGYIKTADARIIDLTGKTTLAELTALLSRSSVLITNDSGPMHIAGALGRPVVALFGPTDPRLTGPYGSLCRVIESKIPCGPCFKSRCRDKDCMASIPVEEVVNTVEDVL